MSTTTARPGDQTQTAAELEAGHAQVVAIVANRCDPDNLDAVRAELATRATANGGRRGRIAARTLCGWPLVERIWPARASSTLPMAQMSPTGAWAIFFSAAPCTWNSPLARRRWPSASTNSAPSARGPPNTRA